MIASRGRAGSRAGRPAAGRRWRSRCTSGFFGGTWVLYPDRWTSAITRIPDIYSDTNAFVHQVAEWMTADVPAEQEVTGQPRISIRQESSSRRCSAAARARASSSRSGRRRTVRGGGRLPAELWNLRSERSTVAWPSLPHPRLRLRDHLERNWARLGPKLKGQIHVFRATWTLLPEPRRVPAGAVPHRARPAATPNSPMGVP